MEAGQPVVRRMLWAQRRARSRSIDATRPFAGSRVRLGHGCLLESEFADEAELVAPIDEGELIVLRSMFEHSRAGNGPGALWIDATTLRLRAVERAGH